MPDTSLELTLQQHCIATEAKRAYEKALSQYFRSPTSELESRIELLKLLLEQVDLPALRAAHPELQGGGSRVGILLEGERLRIESEGRTLHTQDLTAS